MLDNKKKTPSFLVSLIPIIVVAVALGLSVFVYDTKPHPPLLLGIMVVAFIAICHKYKWQELKTSIIDSISKALPAIIILLIIGMLIGTWIGGGVVPALMYYGFYIFQDAWFLPSILILSALISVVTGSSWTTAGTVGVAAIGLGQGLGIPLPMIAGAVVSGSFFGDKISPLSDSTNLTPSILDVDIYQHVKHMLLTTLPVFAVAIVFYSVMGLFYLDTSAGGVDVSEYQRHIAQSFNFSYALIIPPLAVIALIIFKVPAIPSLTIGVVLGAAMQIFVQGDDIGVVFKTLYGGVEINSDWQQMDNLFSRGGMSSMYSVIALAIVALPFGGLMHDTGMLKSIVAKFASFINKRGPLVLTTILTSLFINIFGANQYLSVILPGQMYKENYKLINLHRKNLTRALEGGGTLTAPLIPWNSSGVFMLSVLGVRPLEYAPYAIICWLTMIVVVVYAYANITMTKCTEESEEVLHKACSRY